MPIPVMELARRICIANHRADLGYPSKDVPCSAHTREAKLYLGLTEPKMAKTLEAVIQAAGEF